MNNKNKGTVLMSMGMLLFALSLVVISFGSMYHRAWIIEVMKPRSEPPVEVINDVLPPLPDRPLSQEEIDQRIKDIERKMEQYNKPLVSKEVMKEIDKKYKSDRQSVDN